MSDSDSSDSDSGVRYKTTTTRHNHPPASEKPERPSYRDSSSSRIRYERRYNHRSRTPTPERRRYRRRSRTPESSSRSHRTSRSARSSRNASPEPSRRVKEDVKTLDVSVSSVSSQDDHAPQRRRASESPTECFGPALPPALVQPTKSEKKEEKEEEAKGVIGPALPPHLLARQTEQQDEDREEKDERSVIGPALPPGMKLPEAPPSHDHATSDSELSPFSEPEENDEPDDDGDDDDEMIGPLPGTSGSRANVELEQRALEMKIRQIESAATGANGDREQPKAREDWMLELPDIRKISDMGLGARQFRTREKQEIGDRTVWTDTPADRERKKASGGVGGSSKAIDPAVERERERERKLIAKRDKEQEELVKRHKKKHKRDKALLEIHQKKLKKEKESKGDEESIRRPFDRNVDLQANRFDEAQKKAVLKKAQLLDTRFSSGSSKYL
ncbi:GPALPP motifs-containing protein 1-like [Anopheles albimanus]|uniref:Uncharacterized protein n=1 Tax=Anopheles albimanus TaxID=7167 RepID=A0A1I8JST3_ANOAL|nr:GPALPP motifs-containing protein 1-like [Anopheles albimanus]